MSTKQVHFDSVPVESFDEALMDNELVNEENEYDSEDSDDSQNVSQLRKHIRQKETDWFTNQRHLLEKL